MECLGCKKVIKKDERERDRFYFYFEQKAPKIPLHHSENLVLLVNNSGDDTIKRDVFSQIIETDTISLKIIEKSNPMYTLSKRNLKLFERNLSRRNIKRFIIVFLINPNFIESDLKIFLPLAELFMKYKDKSLYCMSYITLTENLNHVEISGNAIPLMRYEKNNNVLTEKISDNALSFTRKNATKDKKITKVMKTIDMIRNNAENISYFKCYSYLDTLKRDLVTLFWKLGVGNMIQFEYFHIPLKCDNYKSFSLNMNRRISYM